MPTRITKTIALAVAATALVAAPAAAQTPTPQRLVVEAGAGYAGFVDEAMIDHLTVGGGARWFVTPRLAIGPEVVFMRGPGEDHRLWLTGNATVDLRDPSTSHKVTPYLVASYGWVRNTDTVGTGPYTSNEPGYSGGFGVRISPSGTWFVAPEIRFGSELHWRLAAQVGITFK